MNDYPTEFYDKINDGSKAAARHIVPMIIDLFDPKSVVDFGCGTGSWLSVMGRNGVERLQGLDFGEVKETQLEIASSQFMALNLGEYVNLGERFDLALCLEVAEHVAEEDPQEDDGQEQAEGDGPALGSLPAPLARLLQLGRDARPHRAGR